METTINYYKSLQMRIGLGHIHKHPLATNFKFGDNVDVVVNTMILREFPALGITYRFCKPQRNTTPYHFAVKYKVDGVGFLKGYEMPMKMAKEAVLKYSSEELKNLSPLDIIVAAYWATNCTLVDGIKTSKLIDEICVYLHDATTVYNRSEHEFHISS